MASVLENLRLAVRSQLGFTSIRLPTSSRQGNIWRRFFSFTRLRRAGSLALVSTHAADNSSGSGGPAHNPDRTGPQQGILPLDSDDTDTESERRDIPGAVGGHVSSLPVKTPPATAVEAIVSVSASSTTPLPRSRDSHRARDSTSPAVVETHTLESPGGEELQCAVAGRSQLSCALSQVSRSLRWVRFSLGCSRGPSGGGQNHSPLRQLEHGAGTREDEDDVELLIPVLDAASVTDSTSETSRLLNLEVGLDPAVPCLSATASIRPGHVSLGWDGPCEHCSMVHTARIPDACLESTGKTETNSDDELLLLC
ncbi:hypothetical protein UPYG_G00342760 [Umbra pygmaea]|uniref:Uncharacterized protein n=1 Tax=Umbra pygmaea TaxID=75934 RepID=A0ABD0W1K4_UMBPY